VSFGAPRAVAEAAASHAGGRLDQPELVPVHLDKSLPYIGADRVKAAVGERRAGPSVMAIDTGTDSAHPDFQEGNLAANVQPVRQGGLVVGSLDQAVVVDTAGHGTHVAGILAGSGDALGPPDPLYGRYQGVYSNGRIVSYQASSEEEGQEALVDTLAALEAFDWAIENRREYDIRVVTNSWGDTGGFDPENPVNQATLRLYLAGMTVVFSAGNSGEDGPGTLNKYCVAPWVLCVAAGDLSAARLPFSGYGRSREAPPYDHPDLTAPGLAIHAARPVSELGSGDLVRVLQGDVASDKLYQDRSGTSMAAPHVAAAAALLQAANGALSPDQVMDILVGTTSPMADGPERVGTGYVDAVAAYNLAVQTVGNREPFLAGREVKYAGPASRDPTYGNDPVTVGYSADFVPSPLVLAPEREALWVSTPAAWVLLGAALLSVLGGTRLR
jgi:serine protease AprX